MTWNPPHAQLPLAILVVAIGLWYAAIRRIRERKLPLPPCPKPDPFIGHMRKLPKSGEHLKYAKWGQELNSDIISLSTPGRTVVILNSSRAANDLLERRSAIYSTRPQEPMTSYPDLVDWSKRTGRLPYGERWRSQRRMTHAFMHKKASMQHWPTMVKQARQALRRLSASPGNFIREFKIMNGATLMSVVYGYEVTSQNDPMVEMIENAVDNLCQATIPSNFLVNTIPALRYIPDWFPGAKWKQNIKVWRRERDEMMDAPFNWTKEQIANGTAEPSAVKDLLAELENNSDSKDRAEEEDKIKWMAGSVFSTGTDPASLFHIIWWRHLTGFQTAATTSVFVLAMALHQDILAKAQAEVDEVVGRDRLPEMSDRDSMPYLECIMKEVLRWQPVTPLAIPHETTAEDEYRGYRIPKGTHVVANMWAMNYNESVYPEPKTFNPDRFLDPAMPYPPVFGFGRRVCPGNHIVEAMLFISMASLLSLFDIRLPKDKDGNDIVPVVQMNSNALIGCLEDFECSITPRSEKSVQMLDAAVVG